MSPSKDPARAQQAASHPNRPGEKCKTEAGTWRPVVDRQRCEGKSDCVSICPYGVFEVGPIREEEYRALPVLMRLKLLAHGKRTAYTPNAEACRACGLCVVACPERAITLERLGESR